MCGDTKTAKKVESLFKDETDVLVATAGCVLHMLKNDQLIFSVFSCLVFDEAHHATGGSKHDYVEILKILHMEPKESRPRLLGLTATPFGVKTIEDGKKKLTLI